MKTVLKSSTLDIFERWITRINVTYLEQVDVSIMSRLRRRVELTMRTLLDRIPGRDNQHLLEVEFLRILVTDVGWVESSLLKAKGKWL